MRFRYLGGPLHGRRRGLGTDCLVLLGTPGGPEMEDLPTCGEGRQGHASNKANRILDLGKRFGAPAERPCSPEVGGPPTCGEARKNQNQDRF